MENVDDGTRPAGEEAEPLVSEPVAADGAEEPARDEAEPPAASEVKAAPAT